MSNIFQFPTSDIINQKLKDQIDSFNSELYQLVLNFKQNDRIKQMYQQVTESELTDKDIAALLGNTVGLALFKMTDNTCNISDRVANFLDMTVSLNRGINLFKDTIIQETNNALRQDKGDSDEG